MIALQVECLCQLDCSSCHLSYEMNTNDLNADGPTVNGGKVRRARCYRTEDIDALTGNSIPGATKVEHVWGFKLDNDDIVHDAWSLRMFVLDREPASTHSFWKDAKKPSLVEQVCCIVG